MDLLQWFRKLIQEGSLRSVKCLRFQMAIQATKSAQGAKKLDPTPDPAKGYHLQPVRKRIRFPFNFSLLDCVCFRTEFPSCLFSPFP